MRAIYDTGLIRLTDLADPGTAVVVVHDDHDHVTSDVWPVSVNEDGTVLVPESWTPAAHGKYKVEVRINTVKGLIGDWCQLEGV